jgi:drug/metabolite transporter (DMT)-like permease
MNEKEKQHLLGALFAILGALCNTFMVMLVKLGLERGETISAIIFWRSFWGLVILIPVIAFFKKPRFVFWEKAKTSRPGMHLLRAIGGGGGVAIFFYCASKLSIAVASLLFFTIPLFMPIVGYLWKRYTIPKLSWFGLAIGFAGVILVIRPSPDLFKAAALIGVLSGLFGAFGQFAVHLLSKTDGTRIINFYYFSIIGLIAFGLTFLEPSKNWLELTAYDYFNFFAIGIFGYGYVYFVTTALKFGRPAFVTSFLYSAVLFAIVIDWFVWGEVVDLYTIFGSILIIVGVVLKFFIIKKIAQ